MTFLSDYQNTILILISYFDHSYSGETSAILAKLNMDYYYDVVQLLVVSAAIFPWASTHKSSLEGFKYGFMVPQICAKLLTNC